MVKVKYELGSQPISNLWLEARNAENPSVNHKDAEQFKIYLNSLLTTAFKEGRNFQKNLKEDENYGS